MKSSIKIFLLLTIYLKIVLPQTDLHMQFDYAKTLYDEESYFDAVTEFKRLAYFDSSKIFSFPSNFYIGSSYKYGGFFDNAITYFKRAEINSNIDDEKYEAEIEIIKTNLLRGTFEQALVLLKNLEMNIKSTQQLDDINYWRGWTYMLSDEWGSAAQHFARIDYNHPLKLLCSNVEDDKYSVTFAKLISYILPGFGQFYTGEYLSGLMSLGWNVLWGYVTLESFAEDRVFDGIAVGSLLWLRFYRGNIQNAEKFAKQKNIEIAAKALEYLNSKYQGIKP